MSQAIVAAVKAGLEVRGFQWRTNEDAFEITGRVAWALRNQGAMLIRKRPEQNGAVYRGQKYSHDAIAFPAGWIDCLLSAGPPDNDNTPAWNPTDRSDAPLALPFDLDAGFVSDPPPRPTDPMPDAPPTPTELAVAVTLLAKEVQRLSDDLRTKGLTGRFLGYAVKLTIPDVK